MKMIKVPLLLFSGLFSISLFAQQNVQVQEMVATSPGTAMEVQTVKATATVVGIDNATRKIKLKQPNGEIHTITAGQEVRNFDQIKLGDTVNAEFTQALSLELKKGTAGIRERSERDNIIARAPEGAKPGGAVGNEVRIIADVVSVRKKDGLVALRGPDGGIVNLTVKNPDHLKNVEKGDQVQATYFESLAVAVSPLPNSSGK